MKTLRRPPTLAALLTVVLTASATSAHAGTEDAKSPVLSAPETASPWRIGAAYAPIFGLDVKFSGLGTFGSAFPVQPIAPGTNYNYDNGYVHVDSSGNLGGQTWNWGYQDPSQVNGQNVTMSLTSSKADATVREADEIAQGIDLFAYYRVGDVTLLDRKGSWGLRGGLHYGRADIGNGSTLTSATTIVQDTYTLPPGVIVPAPHQGTYAGPGPLLNDTPVRNILNGTALISGSRNLDVSLTTLSFGAYLEVPLAEKFSLTLEGGLNAALADGSYEFRSTTNIPGLGTVTSAGRDSDTAILPGLYLGVSGIYEIDRHWVLQLSGRYQYLDNFSLSDHGSKADLDFGSAFILSAGVVYTF